MPDFLVRRLPADVHEALRVAAAIQKQSMESVAADAIRAYLLRLASTPKGASLAALLDGAPAKAKSR